MINWSRGTKKDNELALKIACRAHVELDHSEVSVQSISMDIIATHTHGCKLKLQTLLDFDLGDFLHDVCGINRHLDRETGKLLDCFLPRCAVN